MAKIHISQNFVCLLEQLLKPSLLSCRQDCMTCFCRVVPTSCSHSTRKPLFRGKFFLRDIDVRLSNRSSNYFRRFLLIVREPVVVFSGLILIWQDSYMASRVNTFTITPILLQKRSPHQSEAHLRSRVRGLMTSVDYASYSACYGRWAGASVPARTLAPLTTSILVSVDSKRQR